jgi:hypothetical protein
MKWFEKHTDDRNRLDSKLIKRKFGVAGYGMYEQLQQIAAENMDGNQVAEWGLVAESWTMATLAEEIGCDVKTLRSFISFCDDNLILEKRNGRLFIPIVLERMNEYAKRQYRKKAQKQAKSQNEDAGTEDTDSSVSNKTSDYPDTSDISALQHNTTQHNTAQVNRSICIEANASVPPSDAVSSFQEQKPDKKYGNELVNQSILVFTEKIGFRPTDRYHRQSASTLVKLILKFLKHYGESPDPPEVRVQRVLDAYFDWLSSQDYTVEKMDTAMRKFEIWQAVQIKAFEARKQQHGNHSNQAAES